MIVCTGCSACAVVCPCECITMKVDENGFLRPQVDTMKCIGCSLCEEICVTQNKEYLKKLDEGKLYYAWSDEVDVRITTTSGGIGYALAEQAISEGKLVVGVRFDKRLLNAKHTVCRNREDIEELKGSKYIQSSVEKSFKEIVDILSADSGKEAVVFGTPCQIQGLNSVLRKKKLRERVVLVDIFCHGVPSSLLWKRYLEWLEKKQKINLKEVGSFVFRDKRYSWHTYYMHIITKNREYVSSRKRDPFLKLFSMGVYNQKECFTCEFRNFSGADIRLGDFWGKRFQHQEDGVSMVLLLTEKGEKTFNSLQDVVKEQVSIKERFGQQHTDYERPVKYEKGFEMLKKDYSMDKLANIHDPFMNRTFREFKYVVKKILNLI